MESDREQAARHLAESRDGVRNAVSGLTDAQWTFKPSPEHWSPAEVVEHLVIIEGRVHGVLAQIPQAAAAPKGRDTKTLDAAILTRNADRSSKVTAPDVVAPKGRSSGTEALQAFLQKREHTVAILASMAALRTNVMEHPMLGPLDGYQWILAVAAHSARHTAQIAEVKAHPGFPAS